MEGTSLVLKAERLYGMLRSSRSNTGVDRDRAVALIEHAVVNRRYIIAVATRIWRVEVGNERKYAILKHLCRVDPDFARHVAQNTQVGGSLVFSYRLGCVMHWLRMSGTLVEHFVQRQHRTLVSVRTWLLIARFTLSPQGRGHTAVCKDVRRMIGLLVWQDRAWNAPS